MTEPADEAAAPPGPQRQISVAELLAANGVGDAPTSGRRRRAGRGARPAVPPSGEADDEATAAPIEQAREPAHDPAPRPEARPELAPPAQVARAPVAPEPDAGPAPRTSGVAAIAQVVAAVVVGALVWLAAAWLWGRAPLLAAVAALLVVVAGVLVVRLVVGVRDVGSSALAAGVGAVLTVGPAATTLVGS